MLRFYGQTFKKDRALRTKYRTDADRFGCTVPAVMATRTLPSERDRKMTILLTPFMSCSAKLPIYAFSSAHFPGVWSTCDVCTVFRRNCDRYFGGTALPQDTVSRGCGSVCHGTAELPSAGVKNVMQLLWEKAKDFLQKAFTVIFLATICIWFCRNLIFILIL